MRLKTLLLIILLLFAWNVLASENIYLNESGEFWILGNPDLEYSISKEDGTIRKLVEKNLQQDLCDRSLPIGQVPNQAIGRQIGGLIIYDELKQQEYSDFKDSGVVTRSRVTKNDSVITLFVSKKYPESDFTTSITYTLYPDNMRWDVSLKKDRGSDRTMRITFVSPLLFSDWKLWAPIAKTPFTVQNDEPFIINYGQSFGGPIGTMEKRSVIPTVTFFNEDGGRAINYTVPFEVPKIMVRFTSNMDRNHFYHFNSRNYSLEERPHFLVVNDYLGLRENRDAHAALLISSHQAKWRPSLGWVYQKYRDYFDPHPSFAESDGVWMNGYEVLHKTPPDQVKNRLETAKKHGVTWEELHGHFPNYGLMIPDENTSTWKFEGKGIDLNRKKIQHVLDLFHDYDIKNYIYYNITEATHGFIKSKFPNSLALDENGQHILAFRGSRYPDEVNSCFLMNADPSTAFGKHCVDQLERLTKTYPQIDGIFYDVFGRTYSFDFAHDDGITMVNNKPAYFPIFNVPKEYGQNKSLFTQSRQKYHMQQANHDRSVQGNRWYYDAGE